MVQSDLYGVIDDMNLMASVNAKKEIELLKERITEMEKRVEKKGMMIKLE